MEAQDHAPGDGRGARQTRRCRGGWRWTKPAYLSADARNDAGAKRRPRGEAMTARRPSWSAVSIQPRGPAAQGQAGPGQAAGRSQREIRAPAVSSAWHGPRKRGPHRRPALLETRSTGSSDMPSRDPHRLNGRHDPPRHRRPSNGRQHLDLLWHPSRARSPEPTARARPRSCPTSTSPASPGDTYRRYLAQHHDPALPLHSAARTRHRHPIPSAHRWMTFMP